MKEIIHILRSWEVIDHPSRRYDYTTPNGEHVYDYDFQIEVETAYCGMTGESYEMITVDYDHEDLDEVTCQACKDSYALFLMSTIDE